MIKTLNNGVLRVTKEDGSFLELGVHPSTRKPWKSEEEAFNFPINSNYPFRKTESVTEVSAFNFKLLFSPSERVAIKDSADSLVKDFYEMLNDPRLETVVLSHVDTVDGVNHLRDLGLITSDRALQILAGRAR
ncbi:hypothetical protein [Marinomonas atlantica]|uniref:hypothetical protein n=1 Tax=Marinomonas atlantica TaxID=1806668 RepID=UPI000831F8C8|nr:hypothetical protein [Marinomonas atlantica]